MSLIPPVQESITNPPPRGCPAASEPRCPWELCITRVVCRLYGLPKLKVPEHEARSHAHAVLPWGATYTSSHLQHQRDGEDPKEEGHQPKATNEEGSPSHALDDQALGQGHREAVITPLLAASEGDHDAWNCNGVVVKGWL